MNVYTVKIPGFVLNFVGYIPPIQYEDVENCANIVWQSTGNYDDFRFKFCKVLRDDFNISIEPIIPTEIFRIRNI